MIRLNELRGQRTQAQMAQLLGLPRETYRNYEVGTREPPLETLVKMANFFGVSVDYILGLDELTPEEKVAGARLTRKTEITPKEDELLYVFRSLPGELQDAVLSVARTFAGQSGQAEQPQKTNLQKKA